MSVVRLDDNLFREVEKLAARSHKSVQTVVEDAVKAALASAPPPAMPSRAVELPTFTGTGLQPGVNLDNTAELLDVMESGQ